jgi:hypothetical protein
MKDFKFGRFSVRKKRRMEREKRRRRRFIQYEIRDTKYEIR